jgi:hypothetical protein
MLKPSDSLRGALTENARELQQAQADAVLFERLSKAKNEVTMLKKVGADLTAGLNDALAEEAKVERELAKAKFRNLRIAAEFPGRGTGALHATFTIKWEGPRWNYQTGVTDWSTFGVLGFPALLANYPEVFSWMMQFHPDALPSLILELGDGDAEAAMDRYLVAMRRGYN